MNEFKEMRRIEQNNVLKYKKLHGLFFNQIEEVPGEEKWLWLRDRSIKRKTESLIMAAQKQGRVNFEWALFQGNSSSSLLNMNALIPLTLVLRRTEARVFA